MQRSDSQPDVVPNQQVIPGIIRHYLEHPDLRLEVQKEIYYSLSRWWWSNASSPSRPDIRPRGILDMGPWIALIGMRLPRYEDGKEVDKTGSKDLVRLRMLTIILDLPQLERWSDRYEAGKEGIFWADIVTVGQALDQCYRYRVLEQPTPQDIVAYQDHVKELIHTLKLVNLWHSMNMYRPEKHLHSVHEIRTMKMSSLVDKIGFHEFYGELGESQSPNFQSYELSLELLRTVGKLKIEWTEYPNEHLHLDVENSSLKIFWFGFSIMANPIFQ